MGGIRKNYPLTPPRDGGRGGWDALFIRTAKNVFSMQQNLFAITQLSRPSQILPSDVP